MTTDRIGRIPHYGKGTCRGCRGAVPKGRKTWCSDTCVTKALIRKGDPKVVRREVFRRDFGICASCGFDAALAARIEQAIANLEWNLRGRYWNRRAGQPVDRDVTAGINAELETVKQARLLVWHLWTGVSRMRGHLWEADHITPVIEGGGGCGLDGYRTLCIACHKAETAKLADRRARARRTAARPLLEATS